MKKTVEKYKKLIWCWSLVCLTGLTINLLDIEGETGTNDIQLFSKYNGKANRGLWPFVKFVEHHDTFENYGSHKNDYTTFNGIFYRFDIGEFLLYMGILVAFLIYKTHIASPPKQVVIT